MGPDGLSGRDDSIWINHVGTFGFASIAYWWARLLGVVGRFAGRLAADAWFWMLVLADDIHLVAGGEAKWKIILRVIIALMMAGTPFKWAKFRGSLELDFVGYWPDHCKFEVGISEKRRSWLLVWLRDLIAQKRV